MISYLQSVGTSITAAASSASTSLQEAASRLPKR
jgi:hypothetical protein